MKMPANKAKRPNKTLERVRKIVEKPPTRRIGFDFPVETLHRFDVAVSVKREPSMTAVLIKLMDDYAGKALAGTNIK